MRAVTLSINNKADPNLETMTYGVFSTCEASMRSAIVKQKIRYIFFVTRFGGLKVLAGYYGVRWFCYGTDPKARFDDFVLAADEARFVDPIPLEDLDPELRALVGSRFRPWRHLKPELTRLALDAIDAKPDRTSDYLREIRRLENWNRFHHGHAYWDHRAEGFNWTTAAQYLHSTARGQVISLTNESPSDLWLCPHCGATSRNRARLRTCPVCKTNATLVPAIESVKEVGQ